MSSTSIKEHIQKYGWRFQYVFDAEGEKEDFAYTIGLEESFGHPEIMIFGLERDTMHSLLQEVVNAVRGGSVFKPGQRYAEILSGDYDVMFKPLKGSAYPEYAGMATDYYERPFQIYVMLWPDKNNVLPTESGCQLTVQDEALKIV
jgi:hypothetical protein